MSQKEVGLKCWQMIRSAIKHDEHYISLRGLKPMLLFSLDYDYNQKYAFKNDCILCSFYDCDCEKCCLRPCNKPKSLYQQISQYFYFPNRKTRKVALKCCDKIIHAIKNKIPEDFESNLEKEGFYYDKERS